MTVVLGQNVQAAVHPKNWPFNMAGLSDVGWYDLNNFEDTATADFYTPLAGTFGAVNTTLSKTADTYYTYLDVTGSHGAMGTIVLPMVALSDEGFYTIKLTTDGVVEEFRTLQSPTDYSLSNNFRYFIGFAKERADGNTASTQGDGGYELYSFKKTYVGIRHYGYKATVRSVQDSVLQAVPVHTFNESLKVEVKCSLAGHADAYRAYGTVLYISAPNL
tara:strand:- start:1789 stop:2442 length:654 start_codon:yes stop_codon:yes gene_type:complete